MAEILLKNSNRRALSPAASPAASGCSLGLYPVAYTPAFRRVHRLLHLLDLRGLRPVFTAATMSIEGEDFSEGGIGLRWVAMNERQLIRVAMLNTCPVHNCYKPLIEADSAGGLVYLICPTDPAHFGQLLPS